MNIYSLINWEGDVRSIEGTLKGIHEQARECERPDQMLIQLHEVPTDKDSLIQVLLYACTPDVYKLPQPTRTWSITPRGGLKENTE